MAKQATAHVEINGFPYTLKGECSEDQLLRTAKLVDDKMAELKREFPQYPPTKRAVLTALQIAEEFVKLEDAYKELLAELERSLQE